MKHKILFSSLMSVYLSFAVQDDITQSQNRPIEEQLKPVDTSLRFPTVEDGYVIDMGPDDEEKNYSFSVWGLGYARSADNAYSCNGRWKLPLAVLYLGKSCFKLREAFPDCQASVTNNPWVNVSEIKPTIDYHEKGAHIGMEYGHDVKFRSREVRIGARAYIPIKSICITRRYGGVDAESEIDSLDDVRRLSTEVITGSEGSSTIDNSFAYRWDFLSSLCINDQGDLLIDYTKIPIEMNTIDITDNNSSPVNVIGRTDGSAPSTPFAAIDTNVVNYSFVGADGSGIGNDARGQFNQSTNYTPLSTNYSNQEKLWMVPTVTWDGSEYNLMADASTLRTVIENIINTQIDSSVIDYLIAKNINLGTQQTKGFGDLSTQLFMQWTWPNSEFWSELNCEFVFPTGKKSTNPYLVFCSPLGNNGHVEIGPGFDVGWQIIRWLSLNADFSYHFVLKHSENVAAAFCGACVKNIGPCTQANISWNYLKLNLDANIIEPKSRQFGLNAGYELYFKDKDRVSFRCAQVNDFEGNSQQTNSNLLAYLTRQVSHKLRAEFFFSKNVGSIFGGFSYIVAGKNIPQESSWHVGLMVEF